MERVTKRFYERFKQEHAAFLKFVKGITETADREWYASVMLNRLMFVYFIQRKGFLDGDRDYLRNRLNRMRERSMAGQVLFVLSLFPASPLSRRLGRSASAVRTLEKLLGRIPYLNGGLFDIHELEQPDRYGKSIEIPDTAFETRVRLFRSYQWHLDERPLRDDNEINPDVLGYIFEKYINQKQMGAYYTKEDITEYIGKNTVIPFLFDAARAKCKIAFENPNGPNVWDLLRSDPDRYIYPAVRHGITWRYEPTHVQQGEPLERPFDLPAEIAAGLNPPTLHQPVGEGPVLTLELRKGMEQTCAARFRAADRDLARSRRAPQALRGGTGQACGRRGPRHQRSDHAEPRYPAVCPGCDRELRRPGPASGFLACHRARHDPRSDLRLGSLPVCRAQHSGAALRCLPGSHGGVRRRP